MSVSNITSVLFKSGPIRFGDLRKNFKVDGSGAVVEGSIKASELYRETAISVTNPIVPDADENENIPAINSANSLFLSNFRNSVKQLILRQSGTDENLYGDSYSDWGGNLTRNVKKILSVSGTVGSDDNTLAAFNWSGAARNVNVEVTGTIVGTAGAGGTLDDPPGGDGGDAVNIESDHKLRIIVKANGKIRAGGGGGEAGVTGSPGAPGAPGAPGDSGSPGTKGTDGDKGPDGAPGPSGQKGANGKCLQVTDKQSPDNCGSPDGCSPCPSGYKEVGCYFAPHGGCSQGLFDRSSVRETYCWKYDKYTIFGGDGGAGSIGGAGGAGGPGGAGGVGGAGGIGGIGGTGGAGGKGGKGGRGKGYSNSNNAAQEGAKGGPGVSGGNAGKGQAGLAGQAGGYGQYGAYADYGQEGQEGESCKGNAQTEEYAQDGQDGAKGQQGERGAQGSRGEAGGPGSPGQNGGPGENGEDGEDGGRGGDYGEPGEPTPNTGSGGKGGIAIKGSSGLYHVIIEPASSTYPEGEVSGPFAQTTTDVTSGPASTFVFPAFPTYSITKNKSSIAENETITFTVTTTNVPSGEYLYFTLDSWDIGLYDFAPNSLSEDPLWGTFQINNGTGTFSVTSSIDDLREEQKEIIVAIRTNDQTGSIVSYTTFLLQSNVT